MPYLNKKSIENVDLENKKVLVRCDLNVPFDQAGDIFDTKRITESLETINYLINNNSKIIICSHLGRPKNNVYDEKLSLRPVAKKLSDLLNKEVKFSKYTIGEEAKKTTSELKSGEVCLLENLRFFPEEEQNDLNFAEKLASLAEIYVNDAFGTSHRAHASTVGVTKFLPSVCGFLIKKEISIMSKILENPERPFVSVLGGSKVSDKIGVINSLLEKVDILIIGGGMAYTFMNALGYSVGTSICEYDKIELAKDIMTKAKEKNIKLFLPVDNKVGTEYKPDTEFKTVDADKIPDGWMGLDIGEKTAKFFSDIIKKAKTIIWNGTLGVSEWENFSYGTFSVAKTIAESDAVAIIGGGDSAAAVEKLGFSDKMTHISTGGGASLRFLEGKELPALMALDNK
ncbi:MAG: phosphoglycerate kinase [Candidatus Paraimprobicoccus trichonymphae]|uniref:Phosphoglycerate kinase n=1 Tax=Candidatus Paraimprobicoccus trichonymphae TaxID=3033793 RepID=A0AA48KZP6_9FIRM|nr:MAG: phosphoglycerate kinase [Candidatus Paraimprobicoccus trichonymphae]